MLEALCRQSSTTLDIVHAEDGPPITQRTSGLSPLRHQPISRAAQAECLLFAPLAKVQLFEAFLHLHRGLVDPSMVQVAPS